MISAFDKNAVTALYRREFTESLYSGDYESALDKLLKYDEKIGYADFHLACGKLYLLMAQDSDDNELLVMAFRELMMHLRRFPKCRSAHRDVIAVQMLRHDPAGALECLEFAKRNGVDTDGMVDSLSQAGVDLFMDESVGLDLDGLMEPGEFGDIEIVENAGDDENIEIDPTDGKPRVLQFKGENYSGAQSHHGGVRSRGDKDKIMPILSGDGISFDDDEQSLRDIDFSFADDDDEEDLPAELIDKLRGSDLSKRTGLTAQLALRDAEKYGMRGDTEKAFAALSEIKPSDGHYYYCAECMRAFMYMQNEDDKNARACIDRAFDVHPRGALASTLLCKLYENNRQYYKIAQTLKNADVKDYTDADHVYQAMMFAVKYCKPKDAIALAESYVNEFNTMDIRMLYAQLLYNNGEKKRALKEMFALSRIFYDDFNTQYYYKQASADVAAMPVDEQAPQDVLARVIDGLIAIHRNGSPSDELIRTEDYKLALELFLTLELPNEHKLLKEMLGVINDVSRDERFECKLRDSLVSPYVEPVVKAIILSELLARTGRFTLAVGFCPDSDIATDVNVGAMSGGEIVASAFLLCLDRQLYDKFVKQKSQFDALLEAVKSGKANIPDRDIAYYIIKTLKSKMLRDARVIQALGYDNKKEAAEAYRAVELIAKNIT